MTSALPLHHVLCVLNEQAASIHGGFIRQEMTRLLPGAKLEIISSMPQHDLSGVEVILAPQVQWLAELVAACPQLKWLHLWSAGAERVFEFGLHRGPYHVTRSAGVNAVAMAEYVIAAMLALAKGLRYFIDEQRERRWSRRWLDEISGTRAVILGAGHVGKEIAVRAACLGVQCVGIAKHPRPVDGFETVLGRDDLPMALAKANFLIVAVPLTHETHGWIQTGLLRQLKAGAYLIDVSRGGVVVPADLAEALAAGHLGGAALDVFDQEPLPVDSPFWSLPNVIVTPHIAGTSDKFMARALDNFADNLRSFEVHGRPSTPIDPEGGY